MANPSKARFAPKMVVLALAVILSACQPACPVESISYGAPSQEQAGAVSEPSTEPAPATVPQEIEIRTLFGTKFIMVDEVIEGFLCDDTWRGTVYVTCDIEIPPWEGDPFFFQECKPSIEPGAVIYVAAHNDKAYTEGCTCHE